MNVKLLCDALYIAVFVGCFALFLCIGEDIFNLLYRVFPKFRRWWDKYCEDLPDDEEVYE